MKDLTLDRFVSLLFPKGCVLCGSTVAYDDLICEKCLPDRPLGELCPVCSKPEGSCICAPEADWAFYAAVSALVYREETRDAILRLKKIPNLRIVQYLAKEMAAALHQRFPEDDFHMVTEVPMHPEKLEQRGFNHAQLLAAEVAKALGAPHRLMLLDCTSPTIHHELNRQERFAAAGEMYRLRSPSVKDKDILLVDDILTTGATAQACARQLMEGGAASVCVLTAATTLRK